MKLKQRAKAPISETAKQISIERSVSEDFTVSPEHKHYMIIGYVDHARGLNSRTTETFEGLGQLVTLLRLKHRYCRQLLVGRFVCLQVTGGHCILGSPHG